MNTRCQNFKQIWNFCLLCLKYCNDWKQDWQSDPGERPDQDVRFNFGRLCPQGLKSLSEPSVTRFRDRFHGRQNSDVFQILNLKREKR